MKIVLEFFICIIISIIIASSCNTDRDRTNDIDYNEAIENITGCIDGKSEKKYAICKVLDYEMSVIKDANDIGAKIGDLSDGIRKIKYLSLYECPEDFKIAFKTYIEAREKQLKRLEESEDYYNKYMSGIGFIKMAIRAITLDLSLFEEMDSEGRASLSNLIDATNDAKAARENVLNVAEKYDVDTSKYKHYK